MAFRWRVNDGPIFKCWLGSFVTFQGIRTNIVKKPYFLKFFRGGGGPDPLSPLWIRPWTVWMQRLNWAFAARLCNKKQNLIYWLIYCKFGNFARTFFRETSHKLNPCKLAMTTLSLIDIGKSCLSPEFFT